MNKFEQFAINWLTAHNDTDNKSYARYDETSKRLAALLISEGHAVALTGLQISRYSPSHQYGGPCIKGHPLQAKYANDLASAIESLRSGEENHRKQADNYAEQASDLAAKLAEVSQGIVRPEKIDPPA